MLSRGRARVEGQTSAFSWVLVAIQGVLFIAIVVIPSSWGPSVPTLRLLGGALFVVGGVVSLAAAWFLGRALTAVPEPNGAGMSARGVYGVVRHPMYTGVIIAALGVALFRGAVGAWIVAVVLAFFFEFKTRREERFLMIAYPGYRVYASRTGKFIPWLGKRRASSL